MNENIKKLLKDLLNLLDKLNENERESRPETWSYCVYEENPDKPEGVCLRFIYAFEKESEAKQLVQLLEALDPHFPSFKIKHERIL